MSIELFRGMNFALATGLRLAGILLLAIGLTHVLRLLTRRLVKLATSESRVARMREQQNTGQPQAGRQCEVHSPEEFNAHTM